MNEAFIKQQFKKGVSGNPKGRGLPKGSEELRRELEMWMHTNHEKFVKVLGKYAYKHPIAFMRDIYIPLQPQSARLMMTDPDGKSVIWRCITEMGEANAAALMMAASAKPAIDVESKEVPDGNNP